jgi:hypothetical protein
MAIIPLLTAIFKTFPILKDLFDRFVAQYTQNQIANMKAEYQSAIKKAILDHDQIDLEKSLGSQFAGLPSGNAGSHVVDHVIGVPDAPK